MAAMNPDASEWSHTESVVAPPQRMNSGASEWSPASPSMTRKDEPSPLKATSAAFVPQTTTDAPHHNNSFLTPTTTATTK
eukprot:15346094-Ditylum_brightwellii.AAC.1